MTEDAGAGWIPRVKNLEDDAQALRVELKAALGRIIELERAVVALQTPAPAPQAETRKRNWL